MDVDRAKRLEELRTTALFRLDKSGLSKEDKIRLSYERFRAMAKAAELTRQDVLDGTPVVELFDTDTMSVDTSLALICITHYVICLGTILHLAQGRDDLDDVIDELMSLETICPALLTELGYGNNVQSLETEARFLPESQEFDIHTPNDRALKFISYTGSPAVAKTGLVYARLWVGERDCGVHPFIVPIRRADGSTFPGVTVRAVVDRMTPDPLDHAITRFDHVRVPYRMFLGGRHNSVSPDGTFHTDLPDQRAIFLNTMDRLDFAKLSLITGAQRMARISLALALEFAAQRTIVAAGRGSLALLPVAAGTVLSSALSHGLLRRWGSRPVIVLGLALLAGSFTGLSILTAATPRWQLEATLSLSGLGMGLVMGAATSTIMSLVPRDKAGAGAGVNNTLRQVGAALGVAVLGSVLSQRYRTGLGASVDALPGDLRDRAANSLGGTTTALAEAGHRSGGLASGGAALLERAEQSYLSAMHVTVLVAAAALTVTALAALRWLPGRATAPPVPVPVGEEHREEPVLP